MSQPFVKFRNVGKKFSGRYALNELSFDVLQGSVHGVVGPNGAGKTTGFKLLVGLLKRFEGEILVDNASIRETRNELFRHVGYVPQIADFQSWRTVEHTLETLGRLSGATPVELKKRIPQLLEEFELADCKSKKIKHLSGGMKQKVAFIQALLHKPKLLVLDESFAGLDPRTRHRMKEKILDLRNDGTTVIFSSHILSELEDVADRICIMLEGRAPFCGTISELRTFFDWPVRIEIEFSKTPQQLGYLEAVADLDGVENTAEGAWTIKLDSDAKLDESIHYLVKSTLENNGQLRKIGSVTPSLVELYSKYIETSAMTNFDQEPKKVISFEESGI